MAENITQATETAEVQTGAETQKPLTFDEVLKDKTYQSEFDKRVAKALETSKAKWEKEYEAKIQAEKNEAEKLAKMSEQEKFNHELAKIRAEKEEAQAKLNAYELKNEAQKIAREKDMDLSLLDIIDYSKETAESVKEKLDLIYATVSKATEKKLNERLKQPEPKNVAETAKKLKELKRASY